jgi:hypothetical protein
MYQYAIHIWNQIAQEYELKSPLGNYMFRLNSEELDTAYVTLATTLEQLGLKFKARTTFLTFWPLIAERDAIAFCKFHWPYADYLLPIFDLEEFVILARGEHRTPTPELKSCIKIMRQMNIIPDDWMDPDYDDKSLMPR